MSKRDYTVPRRCRHQAFKMKITPAISNYIGTEGPVNKDSDS